MTNWFWWHYAAGGILGWVAVGLLWWGTRDLERALWLVCTVGQFVGGWVGYALVAFWLFSTALAAGLGLVALLIVSITRLR